MWSLLLAAFGLERLVELVLSSRNARYWLSHSGVERGRGHFPWMVLVHTGLLVGCLVEPLILDRPFIPALGWTMLTVAVGTQALRWWCIHSLGRRWNTRVIVVPGAPLVRRGPYRWLRHPNYLAVVIEGLALPLVHSAWLTALLFTVANYFVLRARIPVEEAALESA